MDKTKTPNGGAGRPAWLSDVLVILMVVMTVLACAAIARAESVHDQLVAAIQEEFAASNNEDLPRLLAIMSAEMPNRELFIAQCKKEWAETDQYYRLDDLQIVQQNEWRPPYVVATVTQTITGDDDVRESKTLSDSRQASSGDELSNLMSLNTHLPTTQQEVLFKRERGKFKIVASLTEPREVGGTPRRAEIDTGDAPGGCKNGQCQLSWPQSSPRKRGE